MAKNLQEKKQRIVQKGKFYYVNHKSSRIAKRKYNNKKRRKILGGFKIKTYFCALNLSNEQLFITKEFN